MEHEVVVERKRIIKAIRRIKSPELVGKTPIDYATEELTTSRGDQDQKEEEITEK